MLDLPELTLGGGLGVAYVEGEEAPSITQWGNRVLHKAVEEAGFEACGSWSSPAGRSSPSAAVTLYTVGTIKEIPASGPTSPSTAG